MNAAQIALVQTSFDLVLPIADTAAALFYERLFTLDPALRPPPKRSRSSAKRDRILPAS